MDILSPSSQQIYNLCTILDVEVQLHKDCCCHSCTLAVQLMKMQGRRSYIISLLLYVCAPTCKHNHCCNFGTEWNMCTSPESVPNQNENPIEKGLMRVYVCMYVCKWCLNIITEQNTYWQFVISKDPCTLSSEAGLHYIHQCWSVICFF
jgi:hypothetical protein